MSDSLTIGILAKRGGVNVETIRYYQRRALLEEPLKPRGGFRRYPEESVKRVLFIKRAQTLGFTLEEIQGLLALDERKASQAGAHRAENCRPFEDEKVTRSSCTFL
jgi:MerR family mercuric resistance operon transcriptional regulator